MSDRAGQASVLPGRSFFYHRSVAPMMWVMAALIVVEAGVMHLLLALWSPALAIGLSVLSLATLVWLIALIRSFRRLPVEIGDGEINWRCGMLRSVSVPLTQIGGLASDWGNALIKHRATFNCALIAWPNVVLELNAPVMLRHREITHLAHKLDDRDAFIAALERLRADA